MIEVSVEFIAKHRDAATKCNVPNHWRAEVLQGIPEDKKYKGWWPYGIGRTREEALAKLKTELRINGLTM